MDYINLYKEEIVQGLWLTHSKITMNDSMAVSLSPPFGQLICSCPNPTLTLKSWEWGCFIQLSWQIIVQLSYSIAWPKFPEDWRYIHNKTFLVSHISNSKYLQNSLWGCMEAFKITWVATVHVSDFSGERVHLINYLKCTITLWVRITCYWWLEITLHGLNCLVRYHKSLICIPNLKTLPNSRYNLILTTINYLVFAVDYYTILHQHLDYVSTTQPGSLKESGFTIL